MNRKALALAVTAAVAAPAAYAQSSNVTLYGRAALALDQYSATGATNSALDRKNRTRITDITSRLGVRGTEDLGGGLRAIFVIESGVNMDNGQNTGQSGAALSNTSTGFLASRDSFVGLEGDAWGRVTFGRQSIYWNTNQFIAHGAFGHVITDPPWQSGISGRANTAPVARVSNTLQYQSPVFGGAYARLSYAPNSEAAQGGANTNARILGASLIGNWGPIGANVDWATNRAATGTPSPTVTGKTDHYKAAIGYRYMPVGEVAFVWARVASNVAAGVTPGDRIKQDGFMVNWSHLFGNIQPIVSYGWQAQIKDCDVSAQCDQTKSRGYTAGVRYLLSKRTWISGTYSRIINQQNNFADWVAGGITSTDNFNAAAIPFGADPKNYGILLYHAF